jgi:hypothetical protein
MPSSARGCMSRGHPSQQAIAGVQSPEPGYLAAHIGRVLCEQAKLGTTWGRE